MRANVPYLSPQLLRSRIGKICVAIIGSTAGEMIEKANASGNALDMLTSIRSEMAREQANRI